MAREYARTQRVADHLQRELAVLIRDEVGDPRLGMVSISAVEVSRDFSHAKVFVSTLGEAGDAETSVQVLQGAAGYLRRLLVGCAQYILGAFGPDCDLRRYGDRIAARGGKRAKKCAAVAVARKLAVKLHRLWADAAEYEPLMTERKAA